MKEIIRKMETIKEELIQGINVAGISIDKKSYVQAVQYLTRDDNQESLQHNDHSSNHRNAITKKL